MTLATPTPVVLVTGLHGGPRLRAVQALLRAVPGAVAVHHDLSRIGEGIAHRVLRDAQGTRERTRIELAHGCVSCTLREDLLPVLLRLAEEGGHPLLVVDAWAGVEPRPVAEALALAVVRGRPAAELLHLAAVVTAVDAGRVICDLAGGEQLADRGLAVGEDDGRTVAETLARQVEYPSAVALDRTRVPAALAEQAEALLAQLNPAAALLGIRGLGAVAGGDFDFEAARARTDPATAAPMDATGTGEVRTVAWRRTRPMHPARLHAALDGVVVPTLRSRGRFWLANRPDTMLVWESAGHSLSMEPAGPWLAALPEGAWHLAGEQRRAVASLDWAPGRGDRCQCLWFTGIGIDAERILAELDSCLLSEDECVAAPTESAWEDPFAAFLDDEG